MALKNKATLKKKDPPYLFQRFNVRMHHSGAGVNNAVNKILSLLVEAFNEYERLPKYIIVVPDVELVKKISDKTGASIIIGAVLHHIIKRIDLLIERRFNDLMAKKPGAICDNEPTPKIVWVRMLK